MPKGRIAIALVASLAVLVGAVVLSRDSRLPAFLGGGRSEGGPLATPTLPGAKYTYAPRHVPYYLTNGSFLLCRDDGEEEPELVLEGVDFNVVRPPLEIQPVIRTVPDGEDLPGSPYDWSPIISAWGRPGHFDNGTMRGSYSSNLEGTVIEDQCSEHDDPDVGFMELLVVMRVPVGGADIDGFTIRYRVGRREYERAVPWRMVGCGTHVAPDMCSRRRSRP